MHLTPSQLSPTSLRTTSRPSSGRNRQSRPGSAASAGEPDATAVASVQLRPSTVWLSLPLLQRLQAFFEPLVGLPAATAQQSRYVGLHLFSSILPFGRVWSSFLVVLYYHTNLFRVSSAILDV